MRGRDDEDCFLPSPREIRRACKAIRRTWTPEERAARVVGPRFPARVPIIPDPAGATPERAED